ncbi:MAG: hypothetical protein LBT39_01715 [Treponema sp.]|jgi:CHASE2 domain-containing sensor protein|nr:hypothetical protein [Treponema sp.]
MQRWKHFLIGLGAAFIFAAFYLTGILGDLEYRIYDTYLRFQPQREHIDNIIFLDVDDNAIAYNGVFPWPR